MIANDRELRATREQLGEIENALVNLREQVYTQSPDRFALLAEPYSAEIKRLRYQIDYYLGIATTETSDLSLRLISASFGEGIAPAQVVARTLTALQRGWQRIGEYISRKRSPKDGNELISTRLMYGKHFDLEIVAFAPGSFQISLNAGLEKNAMDLDAEQTAMASLTKLIDFASDIQSKQESFREEIPDLAFQLWILEAMKEIAPPKKTSVEYQIEFSGRYFGQHKVIFGNETRAEILGTIRSTQQHATETGIIREINLDYKTFVIRTQTTALRCRFPVSMEDRVKNLLDKAVRVTGRAIIELDGRIKSLNVREIEQVDLPLQNRQLL
jgi:hypothetical protein